jgi:predicted ATPase
VNRYVTSAPAELDRLALQLSDDCVAALGDSIEAFRELAAARGVRPSPDPVKKREVLFEAIVSLLGTISSAKPLAILLDEFQNVDSGTIEIFMQVLALTRGHIMICGAVADTAENDRKLAEGTIAGFIRITSSAEKFKTLTVDALAAEQVTQMITKIFPDRPPMSEFDAKIAGLSRGNPLYVEEILKSLISDGLITRDRGGWKFPACDKLSFPESLKKAIDSRLELLDEETRNVITGAAVIGPNFRTDLLKAMQGRSESETLEIVDRAKRQGLIVGGKPLSDDELRFTSQHVRDVTYDVADANVRATLHSSHTTSVSEATSKRRPSSSRSRTRNPRSCSAWTRCPSTAKGNAAYSGLSYSTPTSRWTRRQWKPSGLSSRTCWPRYGTSGCTPRAAA